MRNQQKLLAKAISLAAQGHEIQLDRGGQPYICHCMTVMHKVKSSDPIVKQIAIMHDLVEGTDTTISDLIEMGFDTRVTDALHLLTHVKGVSYQTYIDGIATCKDAMLVKLADLRHNSDLTRLKGITEKDFERMQKYQKAYVQLKEALEKF